MSHFLLMAVHGTILAAFFAILSRRPNRGRWLLFGKILGALVGGGLLLAWLMYFFPSGPPAPIP